MKRCKCCRKNKPLTDFSPRKNVLDGRYSYCRICVNKQMRDSYHKNPNKYKEREKEQRRQLMELVNNIKQQSTCKFCPEKDPCCLDFHHLDSNQKDESIAYLVGIKSRERLMKEIEKCIVVCANCHRKIHSKNKNFAPVM